MGGLTTIQQTPPLGFYAAILIFAVGLLSACGGNSDPGEASPDQTSTAAPQTTVSTEPPTAPTTTAAPTTTSTTGAPVGLSAEEIYSLLSPSIPLIETPIGSGSGILVEGGFVVTNYHVVWPYDRAWIIFPDGTELADVPVVSWDPFADLAVLGPVDVSLPSLSLADGEWMNAGSEVYLIGYPAETDLYPEPSITGGVLSRVREWDAYELTLFQSDSAIAGGQSGGALVNSMGEIVGISTWSFSEAGFAVSTSAADAAEIVGPIIEDHEMFLSESLHPLGDDAAFEFQVELVNGWDTATFFLEGTAGSILEVAIDGIGDGVLSVVGPIGVVLQVDDTVEGLEYGAVELLLDGPYLVQVSSFQGEASKGPFTLASSVELLPFYDPDDGQILSAGQTVGAVFDHHADIDWYSIDLIEGDAIVLWTDAIATDTAIFIMPVSDFSEMDLDDDSGPALFGDSRNALLYYTAPLSDEYLIIVTESVGAGGGSYFLGVDYAEPMGERPVEEEPLTEEPLEEEPLGESGSSGEGSDSAASSLGEFSFEITLSGPSGVSTFSFWATAGTTVAFDIEGPGDGIIRLSGPAGDVLYVDETLSGVESAVAEVEEDGLYFLQIETVTPEPASFTVNSNIRMSVFDDPDDDLLLAPDEPYAGYMDFEGDWDWYYLDLEAGETVTVTASSQQVDTLLFILSVDGAEVDDDSGGGLHGTDSRLVHTATTTGRIFIGVTETTSVGLGQYSISVRTGS